MSWWARRSLRTKIFVAFSALILGLLLATLGFTQLVVSREAQRALSRNLLTTGQVFNRTMQQRAAQLQTDSILLAGDFGLKRVIATRFDTDAYDPQTLASAALSYQRRMSVQLLWMTDEKGLLLFGPPGGPHMGDSVAELSPLRETLQSTTADSAVAEVNGELYQLVAVPVFGPDVIGFLLLGQVIDDSLAAQLKQDTGSDISFLTETQVFASSWPSERQTQFLPALPFRATTLQARATANIVRLDLPGGRLLSLFVPLATRLPEPVYVLIQGSYDAALAPLRALQWRIAEIGAVALAAALLIGMRLSGGIIGPVKTLVAGMHEILRGNLRHRTQIPSGDEIGFLAQSFNEMVGGLEEREHIKNTFGRFVSRDVAEAVLNGHIPLEGEQREVSILFQDLRGFTNLTERLEPTALLRLMNQFFTEVVAAVEAEGGVVKQFTGDGVMALFGAPQARIDHRERAVRAALGIVRRLADLNALLQQQGVPPLAIGVGVHAGQVIAGLIGPGERVEYGVLGEPVNLASRLESLTKDMSATILISRDIAAGLGPGFTFGRTAELSVKGLKDPVQVIEVLPQPA